MNHSDKVDESSVKETHKSGSEADQYQELVNSIADKESEKACEEVRNGKDPELVLKKLSKQLTNKLIHAPTMGLRDPELKPTTEWLFGINESESDK